MAHNATETAVAPRGKSRCGNSDDRVAIPRRIPRCRSGT